MENDPIKVVVHWESPDFWEAVAAFDSQKIGYVVETIEGLYRATLFRFPVMRLRLIVCIPSIEPRAAPPGPSSRWISHRNDIIRASLRSELECACASTSSQCGDKNIVVRSILIYIDPQRMHSEDECTTAPYVLDRLRQLPSQDN